MRKLAIVVQLTLCALLGLALWRIVSDWSVSAPSASPGPSQNTGDIDSTERAAPRDPSFRQGTLLVPLERVHPRADAEWRPHATHFLVEVIKGRKDSCMSAVGHLARVGEVFLSLETGARPARSKLAAFAEQAGEAFHFELFGLRDFRRLFPAGLVPCSDWVDRGEAPLAHSPGVLRMRVGARRVLASRSLTGVRVVQGDAVALARHPLRDAYEVSAEQAGESLIALTHLPGPHVRTLRVVVTSAKTDARGHVPRSRREPPPPAPPAPGHGRFLIPGWTSHDASK